MADFREDDCTYDDVIVENDLLTYPVSCTNVPESLFNVDAAKEHFGKFGNLIKILLRPKKRFCSIEYETKEQAEKAILNAGAYDGFMFDVTGSKKRRRRSKMNDDPDWLPDADVAAELAAMTGDVAKGPRLSRQQKMDVEKASPIVASKRVPVKKVIPKKNPSLNKEQSPVPLPQTRMLDREELRLLVSRAWPETEEQLRALELRDRVVRSRLPPRKGALRGCCPDMCPERERIMRQTQRQVAIYESHPSESGSGRMEATRAVKQYSRSSADQEEPLAYDLRPVPVLLNTLTYLLQHIMNLCDNPEISLGDWFHFLWDRLRAIRKDITQQALSCEGSVALVEACARFHAHCAARLVEEPPSSFDQRLNTENLSKCLQSLKYMYGDLRMRGRADACRREPEFRAYVVLLNMQDANFMWEVQQLDPEVQSSPEVRFAIQVFTALDNNNYIKFFRLVKETTYLNACILQRYFTDVRARALTRMIKSYSPRGISQFPASSLVEMLAFENIPNMELFLDHYGLQIITEQDYPLVVLDKNAFCDNSSSYAQERAVSLIESKRNCSLGETVYGGRLPPSDFETHIPHCSFETDGYLKKNAILAEDQGYKPPQETIVEINNIIKSSSGAPVKSLVGIKTGNVINQLPKQVPILTSQDKRPDFVFAKPDMLNVKPISSQSGLGSFFKQNTSTNVFPKSANDGAGVNLFKSATNDQRDNPFETENAQNKFVFSKPTMTEQPTSLWKNQNQAASNIFSKSTTDVDPSSNQNLFRTADKPANVFLFSKPEVRELTPTPNIFSSNPSIFAEASQKFPSTNENIFRDAAVAGGLFSNNATSTIFGNAVSNPSLFGNRDDELKRKASEAAKIKEDKEREEKRQDKIREETQKQDELKRKIENEKKKLEEEKMKLEQKKVVDMARQKAESEKKEIDKKRMELEVKIEMQLVEIVPEVINEVVDDLCKCLIKGEITRLNEINELATDITVELIEEILKEDCQTGIKMASRLYELRLRFIARRAASTWRKHVARSQRRRSLLRTTPAWLPSRDVPTPPSTIQQVLQRMRAFHRNKLPSFKIPTKPNRQTIDLFETIKKSLLKRSQEVDKGTFSSSIFWKLVFSFPDKHRLSFFDKWIAELFTDNEASHDHIVYLKEHYWYKRYALSVCRTSKSKSCQSKAIIGLNGLIVYGSTENNELAELKNRIEYLLYSKSSLEYIPLVIIIKTQQNENIHSLEAQLQQHKNVGSISEFKFFKVTEFSDNTLIPLTKEALKWTAKRFADKPPIESNLLSAFLDQCIGSELWYRFKLSLHSSIRTAFQNTESIINLYNEALEKATRMVCDPELKKFPVFAPELKEFIGIDCVYPKDFESFSTDWKDSIMGLKKVLGNFHMLQFTEQWPPPDTASFQRNIRDFINKLNWYRDPEKITLKIFSIIKDDDGEEHTRCKYSWLDIMNILVTEKIKDIQINAIQNEPIVVVYRKNDLFKFRTTPWWYKSKDTTNVTPLLEDYPDDEITEFGHSLSKKPRLNVSDASDEIPDDLWVSAMMSDIDTSIKQSTDCQKMLADFEKTLQLETSRQNQLEHLLQSALLDD